MVIKNFKDFLSENAINSLADNKSEKLTDKKDLEAFAELVRYRTQYAKKNGQKFDPKSLEKTKDEFDKLHNFAKSKADPTTGNPDSAAKSTIDKIQKIKDGEDSKPDDEEEKKDKKDKKGKKDKKDKSDSKEKKKEKDAEDSEDKEVKDEAKQQAKKDFAEKEQTREEAVNNTSDKEKKDIKKSFAEIGVDIAGNSVKSVITALATMLGVDSEVSKMIKDLSDDVDKLKKIINKATNAREDAKKERDKALKDEDVNYTKAKSEVEELLKQAEGDDKTKLKETLDIINKQHKDNVKNIKDNAAKKIKKYDEIIGNAGKSDNSEKPTDNDEDDSENDKK